MKYFEKTSGIITESIGSGITAGRAVSTPNLFNLGAMVGGAALGKNRGPLTRAEAAILDKKSISNILLAPFGVPIHRAVRRRMTELKGYRADTVKDKLLNALEYHPKKVAAGVLGAGGLGTAAYLNTGDI